jgi:large subunit ribosomal protein L11
VERSELSNKGKMPKKIKTILKLQIPAGEATPAPPVGPALGQHGIPIMNFVKAFNERTAEQKGTIVPAVITIYEDGSFKFVVKKPPVSEMVKKALGLEKGSGKPGREKVGALTRGQVKRIAEEKLADFNTQDLEAAIRIVEGTARSMGVEVKNGTKKN